MSKASSVSFASAPVYRDSNESNFVASILYSNQVYYSYRWKLMESSFLALGLVASDIVMEAPEALDVRLHVQLVLVTKTMQLGRPSNYRSTFLVSIYSIDML